MIHWGELGAYTGRAANDLDLGQPDIPRVTPIERRILYSSRTSVYGRHGRMSSGLMDRLAGRLSGTAVLNPLQMELAHRFRHIRDENLVPESPMLAPMLAPDASGFLDFWRSNFGKSNTADISALRRQFFQANYFREKTISKDEFDGASVAAAVKADSSSLTGRDSGALVGKSKAGQNEPNEVVDLQLHRVENAKISHTDDFDIVHRALDPHLVVRRGQYFDITVKFRKALQLERDEIALCFETSLSPTESRSSRINLTVQDSIATVEASRDAREWSAHLLKHSEAEASIRVYVGVNAIIGCWNLKLLTSLKRPEDVDGAEAAEYIYAINGVYILFNPWSKDDLVYLPDESNRQEFVLNDAGKIWRGCYNLLQPSSWVFGQFEDIVLEACCMILEKSNLPPSMRANPLPVARAVAAMVNCEELGEGVLVCNWGGNYHSGVPPTEWTGSTEILRQYATTQQPVAFAQCWVLSGVVTTVLRCLGIPCRPVTNYSSGHDSDTCAVVNLHMDVDGKLIREMNSDSVWNFHVWNECWMKRLDLPAQHSGWQALDATPQDKLDGIYCAGPSSVLAIKEGDIGYAFDTACISAEVNATKCYWMLQGSRLNCINEDVEGVGRMVCTKKPGRVLLDGNDDLLDITHSYKHSNEIERDRVAFACTFGSHKSVMQMQMKSRNQQMKDVRFQLNMKNEVVIGSDFNVTLKLWNDSNEKRTVRVHLRCDSSMYTGAQMKKVKADKMVVMIEPKSESQAKMYVSPNDYISKRFDQTCFSIVALSTVVETQQAHAIVGDFRLKMPDVRLQVPGRAECGKPLTLHAEMVNPLPVQLTNCKFIVDGPGIVCSIKEIACRSVMPHGQTKVSVEMEPWKTGYRAVVARFTSDQLKDVSGSIMVNVEAAAAKG